MSKSKKLSKKELKANKKSKAKKNLAPSRKSSIGLRNWISIIAILAITALAFSTSLNNEFVNWDDDRNFKENTDITSKGNGDLFTQTKAIFSNTVIGNYNPLTIWTFAIEERIFGLDQPFYWHLNNLLLHLLCTLLVFRFCTLLKMKWEIAAIVTLLFGIHPLHVESVAWVTERKDVLYGAFYLGAMIQYIKYATTNKKRHLIFVLILFILSLFSKIQAVVLPLSMLAIDYYLNKPINFKSLINKIPFFTISFLFGMLGLYMLDKQGSLSNVADTYPIWVRPFVGTYSYFIYLVKSIVPFRMSPMYPYPAQIPWYFYASAPILPVILGLFFYAWKKQWKHIVFGLAFFTFNIMFLLQVLGAGQGYLADRFAYISFIGLFVIIAYGIDKVLLSNTKLKMIGYGLIALMTAVYSYQTFEQNKIWENSGTLWTHVLKYSPDTVLPYRNRANYYRETGKKSLAMKDYNKGISLKSNDAELYNSRARIFFNSSHPDTLLMSMRDYQKAISLQPDSSEFHINLGAIQARLNKPREAVVSFNKGLRLNPDFANGYLNRSVVLNQLGETQPALRDLLKYQEYYPYKPDLMFETARAYFRLDQHDNAKKWYTKAINQKSDNPLYFYERAILQDRMRQKAAARADLDQALKMGFQADPEVVNRIRTN